MIINCAECHWFNGRIFGKEGVCLYEGINKTKRINDKNQSCFRNFNKPPLRRAV